MKIKLKQNVTKADYSFIIGMLYLVNLPIVFIVVKVKLITNHFLESNIWVEGGCTEFSLKCQNNPKIKDS